MISHRNVITNIMQINILEAHGRRNRAIKTEVGLALLPLSHIYGLVVIAQASTYRGDEAIVLPKFELQSYLNAIQTYKIETLYLVSMHFLFEPLPVLMCPGTAHHHWNDEKSRSMLEIQPQ